MKLDMELTSIGDASSAADWVKQSRDKEIERSKRLAEERRRQYEEQLRAAEEEDEDAVSAPRRSNNNHSAYGSSDLRGMRVMHSSDAFDGEREVILTLADTSVLATDEYGKVLGMNEDDNDILENVHLAEAERREDRQKKIRQLRRGAYSGYDDDEFAEDAVPGAKRSILAHYDKERKSGPRMTLGEDGVASSASVTSRPAPADGTAPPGERDFVSLKVAMKPASSFLTLAEVKARKGRLAGRRVAKRVRAGEEDEPEDAGDGSGGFDLASLAPQAPAEPVEAKEPSSLAMEVVPPEEKPLKPVPRRLARPAVGELEHDEDLSAALARARSLAVRRNLQQQSQDESQEVGDSGAKAALTLLLRTGAGVGEEPDAATAAASGGLSDEADGDHDTEGRRADGKIIFNSTVEFSTRLQATLNERARLRAEHAIRDAEAAPEAPDALSAGRTKENRTDESESEDGDSSMSLDEDGEGGEESDGGLSADDSLGFLHAQPAIGKGLGAALALFRETGDLRQREELAGRAKDSRAVDPSQANEGVKIEYRDEFGRKLTQKEAFRQLSYRFHGYGQGKKKREKTLKAMAAKQATLSSRTGILDGDAGVMKSLTTAQEATGKAHIVVQGGVHASQQQIAALAARLAKSKEAKEKKAKKNQTP